MRLCGDELIEGGTTPGEAVEVARMVSTSGAVDYINTTIGVATATLYMVVASMRAAAGYAMHVPAAIRAPGPLRGDRGRAGRSRPVNAASSVNVTRARVRR